MRSKLFLSIVLATAATAVAGVAPAGPDRLTVESGSLTAAVRLDPFGVSFEQAASPPLVSLDGSPVSPLDPSARYGGLAFAVDARAQAQPPEIGYGGFAAIPLRWFHTTRVTSHRFEDASLALDVATDDPLGRIFRVVVAPAGEGVVSVAATLDRTAGVSATGWSFASEPGERFLGFGERSDGADQTGRDVESWNEEGPFSAGFFSPVFDPI
ncbi:MAG: hypothetical protein L0221_19925, partial [Chloroflexi bacterium]|nr:hypothetical protein [Chloroflexota bacterium]